MGTASQDGSIRQPKMQWRHRPKEAVVKRFFNGYFYKAAMGVGILVLVGLVAADIWLWQSDNDSRPASGAGQGASSGSDVPGLPTPGGDSNSSGASVTDSTILEVEREGDGSGPVLIAGDGATVNDRIQLETTGSLPGTLVSDGASVGDSAITEVQPAAPPPAGGGPSVVSTFGDSAVLVVQGADGNIKQQEELR